MGPREPIAYSALLTSVTATVVHSGSPFAAWFWMVIATTSRKGVRFLLWTAEIQKGQPEVSCPDDTACGTNCQTTLNAVLVSYLSIFLGLGPGRRPCLRYFRIASSVVSQSRPILTPSISPRRKSRRMKLVVRPHSSEASVTEMSLEVRSVIGAIPVVSYKVFC
jgi:hypothetical protein